MAIPLKTLRYQTGTNQTWGFNVMRNIRHKNEQVYLAPIPRGFDIYRVSLAAKMTGLDLPPRRDIKLIPYVLGSANKDFTRAGDQLDKNADVGVDVKWGIRPNLTLDVTVNTDFAQVEADEEQVNLTRFDLFFPEKRPFFLENASTFQFGKPQQIDLFFSRRIGLSPTALPIDILGGGRLSGKIAGGWNVGAAQHPDRRRRGLRAASMIGAGEQLQRDRACSAKSADRATARSSSTARAPATLPVGDDWNRAYGVDANMQVSTNQRLSDVLRADRFAGRDRQRLLGPRVLQLHATTSGRSPAAIRRSATTSIPRSASCRAAAIRRPEFRAFFQPQPKNIEWIRRVRAARLLQLASGASTASCRPRGVAHSLLRDSAEAGRTVRLVRRPQPGQPDGAVRRLQPRRPARRHSARRVHLVADTRSSTCTTRARAVTGTSAYRVGDYYDGDFKALELTSDYRITPRRPRARLDAAGHRPAVRHLRQQPGADQGELLVHDAGEPLGAAAVQRPDRRSSRRTSASRCSTAAAPACSSSTTIAATS